MDGRYKEEVLWGVERANLMQLVTGAHPNQWGNQGESFQLFSV